MSAWFSRVFSDKSEAAEAAETMAAPSPSPEPAAPPEPRRIVEAPVLVDESQTSAYSDEIKIKARMDDSGFSCTFLVDRPLLEGYSCWIPDRATAEERAPLAKALFDHGGVIGVQLHDMTVTVILDNSGALDQGTMAKELGGVIRGHLLSGMPVADHAFIEKMPSEEEFTSQLQEVIEFELNPSIASHGGFIELNRIQGNTAYITMGGGCQGCAASAVTLRQGVHAAFRQASPYLGAILDETDHAAGENPYFSQLPPGMEG